ncbi:MAG TPA: gamma-glutamyl-gamma-aminobutyrate hydrolase family protein [Pyrinomonadaceae bacterium]|nr:gamma-glutamyl-gamma-aminobutyrate hydrolase family protein [Pyrinomonadaceae bacterium]
MRVRPLIGVTMRHDLKTQRFYLQREYTEALEAAGGAPVHVSLIPEPSYVAALMEHLDGILLPGSASDVDPLLYGREPHTKLGSVHPLRDATDALVLEEVERRATPLLAICFGVQIWNVVRGGTLIQDIEAQFPGAIKHEQGEPRERRSHRVRLFEGSLLHALAGESCALVNSHHHQALETIGRDLRATAWTADGLTEAVEDTRADRWAVGVQWHPEVDWRADKLSRALFSAFVEAAREHAARRRTARAAETSASVR